MNPQFPLYIPSKGRAESRLTVKALDTLAVPYRVVVEEGEREAYAEVVDPSRLLILDPRYQRDYDTADPTGDARGLPPGAGAVRNFVWDHAVSEGHEWHWVMDDNIQGFYRLNKNLKTPVGDGTIFRCMEDFVLRYENVAMAGPHYFMFASRKSQMPPFITNSRVYSCNLIRNDVPFRWRCRYNEDTVLSLDMLKGRWCTVLFNAFLQYKTTTQTMRGGNTDVLYAEGTRLKSEALVRLHSDVARICWRYNRWHHYVDYSMFDHPLIRKKPLPSGVDNYGMRLRVDGEFV